MKYGKAHVGKLDDKYYVSVRPANGSGEESKYVRDDCTLHEHMMGSGGAYYYLKKEAQALADTYNNVMFPEYKTWGELSDSEKGALLLAHLYGSVIQVRDLKDTEWLDVTDPSWFYDRIYRIKPSERKVTMSGRKGSDGRWTFDEAGDKDSTHLLIFTETNDELDCDSINMRKLWQT